MILNEGVMEIIQLARSQPPGCVISVPETFLVLVAFSEEAIVTVFP
jgi:hypothetical protein